MKFLQIAFVAVLLVFMGYIVNAALSIPDVQVSYSTDKCVKVINYAEGDNYTCDNMPTKFNHVWAQ